MRENRLLLILLLSAIIFCLLFAYILPINRYSPKSPYNPDIWISKYSYNSNELLDVKFNTHNRGRLYFDILLNGVKTEAYLDTGNAFGICVSEQAAKADKFQIYNYTNVYNSEGALISESPQFKVNSFYIEGKQMKLDSGIIVEGKDSYIGFEPFKAGRITLDYKNKKVAFSKSRLPENITSSESRQVFNFFIMEGNGEGYIVIPIRIDEEEYYAMVDTGASVSVIDSKIANQVNAKQNIFGRVKLSNLEIGSFKTSLPSVSVHSQRAVGRGIEKEIMATIGADVLCQFLVTIDYQQRLLILER
ncbi:hypothetical protein [Lutispora sp.]|uniref:hypothetical protein n=1 Tax=Lutispora sp. TaxID=2828727 RepID=UPI003561E846